MPKFQKLPKLPNGLNFLNWVQFPNFLCASVAFFFIFFPQWDTSFLVAHRNTPSWSLSGSLVLVRVIPSEAKNDNGSAQSQFTERLLEHRPDHEKKPFRKTAFHLYMERETGIEPATSSLGSLRSTTELLPHKNALSSQNNPKRIANIIIETNPVKRKNSSPRAFLLPPIFDLTTRRRKCIFQDAPYASRFTFHASRFTFHALRFTFHAPPFPTSSPQIHRDPPRTASP